MNADKPRATIIETGDPLVVAAEIEIAAPARVIFDLLADPEKHALVDGSKTIRRVIKGPKRLYKGAKFGMSMRVGLPYWVTNEVLTFEEDREIAWCHFMKWQWRYQLTPSESGGTVVREIFDARPALSKKWLEMTGALERNPKVIAKSLVRLKQVIEGR